MTNNYNILIGLLLGLILSRLPYNFIMLILLNITFILISFTLIHIFTSHYKSLTSLNILEVNQDVNMRCLKFTMINNNLLEGEDLFKGIYHTLTYNKEFINFGFTKIIILSVTLAGNR
jgi:hypothetical protein